MQHLRLGVVSFQIGCRLQVVKARFEASLVALVAPQPELLGECFAGGALSLETSVLEGVPIAGEMEVVVTGGLDDCPVLVTSTAFVVVIVHLSPDGHLGHWFLDGAALEAS
jgi:hypothetical protein